MDPWDPWKSRKPSEVYPAPRRGYFGFRRLARLRFNALWRSRSIFLISAGFVRSFVFPASEASTIEATVFRISGLIPDPSFVVNCMPTALRSSR